MSRGVTRLMVDEVQLGFDGEEMLVPLIDDGREHRVLVVLG